MNPATDRAIPINNGYVESILICDECLRKYPEHFYAWLEKEGYTYAGHNGDYKCGWVYVSISRKQYAFGKPGVSITAAMGNHAIRMDEFMTIYRIYKKYEGKNPLSFNSIDRD